MLPRAVGPACRPLACCNGQDTSSCSAGTWPSDLHDGRSIGGALKTPAQTCRLDSPLLTCWEGAAPGLAPPHAAAAATLMQCQARSAHVYARGGSHSSDLARLRMLDSHEQAPPTGCQRERAIRPTIPTRARLFGPAPAESTGLARLQAPVHLQLSPRVPARQHCA